MPTWMRQHESEQVGQNAPCSYDKASGAYIATRIYNVNAEAHIAVTGVDFIAAGTGGDAGTTFTIAHTVTSTVTMVPVVFQVIRRGTDLSAVTVTFEGHVIGVMAVETEHSTASEKILFDMSAASKGIGVDQEGTTKRIPQCVLKVTENYYNELEKETNSMLLDYPRVIMGKVNEDAWKPARLATSGQISWREGSWLYDGNTSTKNRDGSYTRQHRFISDKMVEKATDPGMHEWMWRHTKRVPETVEGAVKMRLVPVGDWQLSQIQGIAGIDTPLLFKEVFDTFGVAT